jgi:hypothetical protein
MEEKRLTIKEKLEIRKEKEKEILRAIELEIRNLDKKNDNKIKNHIGKGIIETSKGFQIEFSENEIIFFAIGIFKEELKNNKGTNKEKYIKLGKEEFEFTSKNNFIKIMNKQAEEI